MSGGTCNITATAFESLEDLSDIQSEPTLQDRKVKTLRICACLIPNLAANFLRSTSHDFVTRNENMRVPETSICVKPARDQSLRMQSWVNIHTVLDAHGVRDQLRWMGWIREFLAVSFGQNIYTRSTWDAPEVDEARKAR